MISSARVNSDEGIVNPSAVGAAGFEDHGLPLDIPELSHRLPKGIPEGSARDEGATLEEPDPRYLPRLRSTDERAAHRAKVTPTMNAPRAAVNVLLHPESWALQHSASPDRASGGFHRPGAGGRPTEPEPV